MPTYLVSDIHGQHQAFQRALGRVGFSPETGDRLYVLGDMVDRGPQSKEVLLYLFRLQRQYPGQIVVIKGNHEQMFEDWLQSKQDGGSFMLNGGDATVRSFLDNLPLHRAFLGGTPSAADQESARQAIRSHYPFLLPYLQSLPLYREEPADAQTGAPHVIFVHAGVRPDLPLSQQTPIDLLWIREDFYLHYQGEPVVVFGHTPVRLIPGYSGQGIWRRGNAIGIDGGAASWQGGILLVKWPSLRTVYVPLREALSSPTVRIIPGSRDGL
jgi:serine/threonine protein phosphatase 1